MYNTESVLENEILKLLWYFEIQTENLISAKRPDLILIKKKKELAELWILSSQLITQNKIERKQKKVYLPGPY